MGKDFPFIHKVFIIILITLSLSFGCAGIKKEHIPEQEPAPTVEVKVEQPKREEAPSPQPPPDPPVKKVLPPSPPPVWESPKDIAPTQPFPIPQPPLRTTKIAWDSVNLREGPGLHYRVIGIVKKGTLLSVLEDKGNWLRVRLQDGSEAWVSKAATSEASKPPSPGTSKPKPM